MLDLHCGKAPYRYACCIFVTLTGPDEYPGECRFASLPVFAAGFRLQLAAMSELIIVVGAEHGLAVAKQQKCAHSELHKCAPSTTISEPLI